MAKKVQITAVDPSAKSYKVQDSQGRTYSRRRELLRKRIKAPGSNAPIVSRNPKDKDGKEENDRVRLR